MNPANIQIVVSAYRNPPCTLLLQWLQRLPYLSGNWRIGSQEYGIDVARNQNVFRFLRDDVPNGRTHLLMIDGDMVPLGPMKEILTEDGDLLWCGYVGQQGSPGHVDNPGCGFLRIGSELLRKIPAPWFATKYNETMTRRLECECVGFARKALASGVESEKFRQVGIVGHQVGGDNGAILVPSESQKCGWGIVWSTDFSRKSPSTQKSDHGTSEGGVS